jgi:hypothetical protein
MKTKEGKLTCVGDEVSVKPGSRKKRSNSVNVFLLVAVAVARSIGWARIYCPRIVVGDVGGESTKSCW